MAEKPGLQVPLFLTLLDSTYANRDYKGNTVKRDLAKMDSSVREWRRM